jgi:four helix bundle protein
MAVDTYRAGVFSEAVRYRSLVDQMRRSAVSISANIAEGAGSGSQPMFARYLGIALGSAYELESHLLLARDIGCAAGDSGEALLAEIESIIKMLTALLRSVRSRRSEFRPPASSLQPPASSLQPPASNP